MSQTAPLANSQKIAAAAPGNKPVRDASDARRHKSMSAQWRLIQACPGDRIFAPDHRQQQGPADWIVFIELVVAATILFLFI